MQALGVWVLGRVGRAVAATAGLMMLLALQPEPVRPLEVASAPSASSAVVVRTLILSEQARRYLALQYRAYPTEFMGCMIGEIQGEAVVVSRVAPADVDPAKSTSTHVIPKQTCEDAGWMGTVGVVHSHPSGERCWYYFPGTQVASSDGQSFSRQPYPVDAIMCGTKVVWIGRDMVQRQIRLQPERQATSVREQEPGNRVHDGAASPTGRD
ncbi:MAG TPA: Mov34/MPN/PAD-1 family protein [Gemmatimonadales bacterium]|nr:Mov34/MPN/PAD-1 family protein [Gemmatimonadales bacterium]